MYPRIKAVEHIKEYILKLTFLDGNSAELDLRSRIVGRGGVFEALEEIDYFKTVRVNPESGTIEWSNGVDLDPDVLYCNALGLPIPEVIVP